MLNDWSVDLDRIIRKSQSVFFFFSKPIQSTHEINVNTKYKQHIYISIYIVYPDIRMLFLEQI